MFNIINRRAFIVLLRRRLESYRLRNYILKEKLINVVFNLIKILEFSIIIL
jgi:hypothetical protein